LKPFEMLVMIKPGLGDEQLAACRGRLEGWLADNGAQMEEIVEKSKRGRFLLFWFDGPGELPDAMAQRIRVDDEILRHLVTGRHPASLKTIKRSSEERERDNGKRG
jgi:ribosomal protein S6